jgi:hypothetical protein
MPFEGNHVNDVGLETVEGKVCKFDVREDGTMKSPQEIFDGGVEFFAGAVADGDRDLAARLTRTNMKSLPYWQAHPFAELGGEPASDAEFGAAMAKL